MAGRLAGKVALVTGGGGGIGAATCRLFAQEGARVAVVDRDREAAVRVASAVEAAGGGALAVGAELSREEDAARAVQETVDRFGRLDVLVANAAVRLYGPVTQASAESWAAILGANLLAAAYCAKHAVPWMARQGGGSIVHVSSVHAVQGRPGMAQYDATKAGLLGLTRAMAYDHARDRIRVNAICPGATLTDFHVRRRAEARGISLAEAEADLRAEPVDNLLGRPADPLEIAYGILFLASDESSYVTGAVLMVDGGTSA